jgi:hypothetical protein
MMRNLLGLLRNKFIEGMKRYGCLGGKGHRPSNCYLSLESQDGNLFVLWRKGEMVGREVLFCSDRGSKRRPIFASGSLRV